MAYWSEMAEVASEIQDDQEIVGILSATIINLM